MLHSPPLDAPLRKHIMWGIGIILIVIGLIVTWPYYQIRSLFASRKPPPYDV